MAKGAVMKKEDATIKTLLIKSPTNNIKGAETVKIRMSHVRMRLDSSGVPNPGAGIEAMMWMAKIMWT